MTEPPHNGPHVGDHVQVETVARVIELATNNDVPGAVVKLDAAREAAEAWAYTRVHSRVWLPLDALVVQRQPAGKQA